MGPNRRQLVVIAVVALATAAVGCGGSSADPEDSTTSTTLVIADAPLSDFEAVEDLARDSMLESLGPETSDLVVDVDFEDGVSAEMRRLIAENVDYAVARLHRYLDGVDAVHVIVIATLDGGRELVLTHDPADPDFTADMESTMGPDSEWGAATAPCRGLGGFAIGYTDVPLLVIDAGRGCDWLDPVETEWGVDVSSDVIAHELFHLAQSTRAATSNVRCVAPVWMVEGQAVAAGWALGVMDGDERYDETRNATLEWMDEDPGAGALKALEGESTTGSEYNHGAFAVEYLVARSGWDRTISVLERAGELAAGSCPTDARVATLFGEAFEQVFGQTLTEFYAEAEPYIDWVYAGRPQR